MDQNLLNFWKNYENVINWGYNISGARKNTSSESTSSLEMGTNSNTNCITEQCEEDVYSSDDSDDIDLGYLEFFKKTLEHQEKIKKEKRKVDKEYGFCNSSSSENESDLTVSLEEYEPTELYGSKADEIMGLESNLLSEFTTFNLLKKPTIWPCIALNLVAPVKTLVKNKKPASLEHAESVEQQLHLVASTPDTQYRKLVEYFTNAIPSVLLSVYITIVRPTS